VRGTPSGGIAGGGGGGEGGSGGGDGGAHLAELDSARELIVARIVSTQK
jgi:hypothetical protein